MQIFGELLQHIKVDKSIHVA